MAFSRKTGRRGRKSESELWSCFFSLPMGVEERDVKSFVDGKVAELIADKGLHGDKTTLN